ncbi:MAG: class I SAM-dependent methyltransferase [Dongiaceae bacterium]
MTDTDKAFTGSIPVLYDRYLGPLLFEPYAADIARRLSGMTEGRILETAAGTGIVTRALADVLARSVEIVATDLNQAMLDHAAAHVSDSRIVWRQADAQNLPFEDGMFDVAVCQFGVMFFPDKSAGYREALRVLKPGGRLVFSVWDRIAANEFADVVSSAVATCFPDDPPGFLARAPYGYHDVARVRDELRAAGFTAVSIETIEHRSRAAKPTDPAIGYCQGSPLRAEIEARDSGRLAAVTKAAADAIAARFGAGPVEGRIRAHVITATRRSGTHPLAGC